MVKNAVIGRFVLVVLALSFMTQLVSAQTTEKKGLPLETELSILRGYPLGNLSPFGLSLVDKYQTPMNIVGANIMYKVNDNNSVGLDYWGGGNLSSLNTILEGADWQNINYVGLGYTHSLTKESWLARFSASIGYVRNDHKLKEKESIVKTSANGFGLSVGVSASLYVYKHISLGLKCSVNAIMLGKWTGESKLLDSNSYYSSFGMKESNTVVMPMIGIVLMTH